MKLMSTLTILAAALSLGTLKATPAHADDSNDPATMQISPADSRPAGAGPARSLPATSPSSPSSTPTVSARSVRPRCRSLRVRARRGIPTPAAKR